jgi:hypothetical protein
MNTARNVARITVTAIAALGLSAVGGTVASAGGDGPTCAGMGGIVNHGQHIVGDYVIGGEGMGSDLTWPYDGLVGEAVKAHGGPAVPGGPGPGFHFPNGFAAGASFCTDSNSPGVHP